MPVTIGPDLVGTRSDPDGNGRRVGPTITRTSSLPSGRAVVGGLLVTLAALGTFLAVQAGDQAPHDRYLVAARAIDEGELLRSSDVRPVAIDLPTAVAEQAFLQADALEGAVALAPLREGGLIQASQVLVAGAAVGDAVTPSHELSLRLPREQALDGALNRGERVDVLATYGSGDEATTIVVVRDAVVTAIGRTDEAGLGDDGGLTLTLHVVDDDAVLRLTHAKDVATVTLIRATRDGGDGAGADRYDGPTGSTDDPPSEGDAP